MARLRFLTVAVAATLFNAAPFAQAREVEPAAPPATTAERTQVPGAGLWRSIGRLIAQATTAGKPATPSPVPAAADPPPAPRFDITRFEVRGNSVLPQELIARMVAPFTGSGRDFGDVQRALESLQDAYARAGAIQPRQRRSACVPTG